MFKTIYTFERECGKYRYEVKKDDKEGYLFTILSVYDYPLDVPFGSVKELNNWLNFKGYPFRIEPLLDDYLTFFECELQRYRYEYMESVQMEEFLLKEKEITLETFINKRNGWTNKFATQIVKLIETAYTRGASQKEINFILDKFLSKKGDVTMEKYYCPVMDGNCPYYDKVTAKCTLDNPSLECDDFYMLYGDPEEEGYQEGNEE